jgi:hypothetical protein
MKWIPALDGSSKLPPMQTGEAATTAGRSLLPYLAIGAGAIVLLGVLAVAAGVAGFLTLRGSNNPEEAGEVPRPQFDSPPEIPEAGETYVEPVTLEHSADIICLTGDDIHLCAAPTGQVFEQLGATVDDPVMLPLTPDQAASVVSASGGTPSGVQGFTVMMLAGPETYQVKLPGDSESVIFLADAQGSPYFGVDAYFPEGALFTSGLEVTDEAAAESSASIAGTWDDLSGPGTLTCAGTTRQVPLTPTGEVVITAGEGGGVVVEGLQGTDVNYATPTDGGGFQYEVTAAPDGTPVSGTVQFTLVSPDVIEGLVMTSPSGCSFTRPITMTRISGGGGAGKVDVAPLRPAEFSVDTLFGSGDTFVPRGPLACAPEEPGGEFIPNSGDACIPLPDLWDTWPTHFDPEAVFLPGDTLIPSPDQGDAYIPPYPADAGWGSKGVGNPTLVSVLDVDAVSVINTVFDLWMVMGIPEEIFWDGFPDINGDLIRVYELDPLTGQQTLWEEVKVTYDAIDITTDQNRLFVMYLFEDAASAEAAEPGLGGPLGALESEVTD